MSQQTKFYCDDLFKICSFSNGANIFLYLNLFFSLAKVSMICKKQAIAIGEMAQRLRQCTALSEDLSSVLIHIRQLLTACNSSFRDLIHLAFWGTLTLMGTYPHIDVHT